MNIWKPVVAIVCCWTAIASAGDIVIELAPGTTVTKAEAKAPGSEALAGTIDAGKVRFKDVPANTPYDVALTLTNGTVMQGVNLGWYSIEPAKPDAEEINADDKQQITAIVKEVISFYNKNDMLLLVGDHDRAVILVQLVRDKAFHSDAGGEVIWHIELWYFKNQHGGWEKVQQANKVLRRERFADGKAYHDAIDHLRWAPELGGLKTDNGELVVKMKTPLN
jgi:hypothetical protein